MDAAIKQVGGKIENKAALRKALETVKAPTTSEVRAQKPEIVTWSADQLALFLT